MREVSLSVIIPVHNEVNTVLEVIRLVEKESHSKEIIVVDYGSTDGTAEMGFQLEPGFMELEKSHLG